MFLYMASLFQSSVFVQISEAQKTNVLGVDFLPNLMFCIGQVISSLSFSTSFRSRVYGSEDECDHLFLPVYSVVLAMAF